MKLGIFDSGLGGLLITKAVRERMPDIDLVYFGDTLHLPYGNRSEETIYNYTRNAMDYLFRQDCKLIVLACNTASAAALRRLQQTWLPKAWPGRNIIGVVVPTLETAIERGHKKLGVIGTNYMMRSNVFEEELRKINPDIEIIQTPTPLLVSLIENDGMQWAESVLEHYLSPMVDKGIECLILGCTHYPFLRDAIKKVTGPDVELISQDDIIPAKLEDYLKRHPEYNNEIGRNGLLEFHVSDLTENYAKAARTIYGRDIEVEKAKMAA
jgi:glutamate racemase